MKCFWYKDGFDTAGRPIWKKQCYCRTTACRQNPTQWIVEKNGSIRPIDKFDYIQDEDDRNEAIAKDFSRIIYNNL